MAFAAKIMAAIWQEPNQPQTTQKGSFCTAKAMVIKMNYNEIRRKTREVKIGRVAIGGNNPIAVQSMTNTPTQDFAKTYAQVLALERAGCDIVRLAVPDLESVRTIGALKESDLKVPLVADIHFDYRLALECAEAGVDKIRINPGNIGDIENVRAVARACAAKNIPIRVGVNSGSLEKGVKQKYGAVTGDALADSAISNIRLLERFDFNNIVVAIKSSDVYKMIRANEAVASVCDYPIHLGVTEAGGANMGTIKSAVGIGSALTRGIGDTLRVSLTDDPVLEVKKGREILASLCMDERSMIDLVSCPTCGRTKVGLFELAREFENRMDEMHPSRHLKVAIMGCAVNGPGEASDADIGIAGGENEVLMFKGGKAVCKLTQNEAIDRLIYEINLM